MRNIFDTDVVSELRKAKSAKMNQRVLAWPKSVSTPSLFLSVITFLELERGVLRVARRDPAHAAVLLRWLDGHVLQAFSGRILSVDTAVARACGTLHVPNPRPDRDALIAATALVHGMTVVTRNIADFGPLGVETLNPWE